MALIDMETALSSFPSSSSSSSSSSTGQWKYDVFISFRGEDTRNTFADLLYDAFKREGIIAFKDDEKLEKGKTISPELSNAIEKSRYAVVIFSKNYASSTWCLNELVKLVQCEKEKIWPVFYDVEPSDVRKQKGTFEQDFIEHEQNFNEDLVKMWRVALSQVGEIAGENVGWPVINRPLSQVIRSIVREISHKLNDDTFSDIDEGLIGLDSRVLELESCLDVGSNDVRFIGIWAMGGMGKTTHARVVYHKVFKEFEACSFIADVRELSEKHGLVFLQQKLVSDILKETDLKVKDTYGGICVIKNRFHHKKILLVLDDVHESDQLNKLAGKHDWFGPGSRIIITTRDDDVLKKHKVNQIYEVKGLNGEHALHLFCLNAFKRKHVPDDYLKLSKDFLNYAGGLPLALEVLGSFLFGKSTIDWKSAIERLKGFPDEKIIEVLQISFDGLHDLEKEIFLYIACIFNHEKNDDVVQILNILGLHPDIGLNKLIDKSLLKIMDDDTVWMHNLLVRMGRNIVFHECPNDPGKRSILCHYEDTDKVLKRNKGTGAVQAIDISGIYQAEKKARWNLDAFSKMDNLKFLRIRNVCLQHGAKHLPNDLRILDWSNYPSKSLPSSFQPEELVQLCLQHSKIERLPIGIKNFEKLKFIDLANSMNLIITPNFTGVPNLEKLVLERCKNLEKLDPSIGVPKKLILLNLRQCEKLHYLPDEFEMESLVILELSGCLNVKKIPKFVGNMKYLQHLSLNCTAITELPSSVERLVSLTSLTLKACKNLEHLPSAICSLKLLTELDLSGCSKFDHLPEDLGNAKSLKVLNLNGTAIKELPSSIGHLIGLISLRLIDCKNFMCLPNSICSLKLLECLDLFGCSKVENLPKNLGNVEGLKVLNLSETCIKELPSSIEHLTSLTSLTLRDCKNLACLPNTICSLKLLKCLDLFGCSKVENLPKNLGNAEGFKVLNLIGTTIKEVPSSIALLKNLKKLNIHRFNETSTLYSMPTIHDPVNVRGFLASLNSLFLRDCNLWTIPSDFGYRLSFLESLDLSRNNFDSLPDSIGGLSSLEYLDLSGNNFDSLPDSICGLSSLHYLDLSGNNFDSFPNSIYRNNYLKVYGCNWRQSYHFVQERFCDLLFNEFKLDGSIQSDFVCLAPGSEIPKWFNSQRIGHKVNIQVPSCYGRDEQMGIALCFVLAPNALYAEYFGITCSFEVNGYQMKDASVWGENCGKIESHQLVLQYLSHDTLSYGFDSVWEEVWSQSDANGICQIGIEISSPNLEVKKIGVRLVFEQEVDDPDQPWRDNSESGESDMGDYYCEKPQLERIKRRGFVTDSEDSGEVQGEDQMSEKLESIHGGKRDSYQDIEDPNQTMTQLSINSSTLYEDLGDLRHNLCDSATEGCRNKRCCDE